MALLVFFTVSCGKKVEKNSKAKEIAKCRIGLQNNCVVALILIAKAEGYFKDQGLDVNFKFYPSGKLAYKGMLAGEVDFSTVADMPVSSHGVDVDASILTVIAHTDKGAWIIARKDKGQKSQSLWTSVSPIITVRFPKRF